MGHSDTSVAVRRSDPYVEVYCADEGWGPWWVPRSLGHTRSSVRTFIAGLVDERYSDLTVRVVRGRFDWHDGEGWRFARDAEGDCAMWEVSQA